MWSARWKFVSLWISQTSRVTADNALRFFVCLDYASQGDDEKKYAWYLVNVIFTLPAILLAPFNGAICNSLPKSRVLHATAFYGFAVMGVFLLLENYWLACWAMIAVGSAIYSPTRYAMLPAAAADTHWALPRINAFIEMGTFSAILAGLILIVGTALGTTMGAIVLVFALNGIAWVAAAPVGFPSDPRRDEPAWEAVRDFFADFRRIWNIREARICLFGLSGKRGLVIGMSGAMIAILFGEDKLNLPFIALITCWVAGGVAVGSLLAGLQKHPRRVLGLVPIGGLGFTLGLMYAAETMVRVVAESEINVWFCALIGMCAGLINVPLAATYQAAVPDDARGNAMAVRNMMDYVFFAVVGMSLGLLGRYGGFDGTMQLWLVSAIAASATLAAWWIFRREFVEQVLEVIALSMYRIRATGPGIDKCPLKGPVIVIANHTFYLDPFVLGKVVPRSVICMMTSVFFDHWVLRWLMIYLAQAIRVEKSGYRREVPELKDAIATLDAGKCLVIFPEGRMRRSEDVPLKLFAQGIWHILKERPDTPVVICWIEGGWGSYFSYRFGPPLKNKKLDIRRPIDIAIGEPQVINPEILTDRLKTRQYLMEQCAELRKHLGLEPIEFKQTDDSEPDGQPADDSGNSPQP